MLKVSDPDSLIAVRLSGQEPFIARDVFAPAAANEPEPVPDDHGPAAPAADAPATPSVTADGLVDVSPEPAAEAAAVVLETEPVREGTAGELDGHDLLAGISAPPEPASAAEAPSDYPAEQLALARTYLEMNMPDEALAPLKAACEAIRFRFEAASLLGRLYQQRGETPQAIEWLERAAEAPPPTEDAGHALLYDLGTLVEASGDTSRALAVFLELQSDAGTYRDVAERVERLARVETGG
jgi:tetratricopeptide (TPR) repeat protein